MKKNFIFIIVVFILLLLSGTIINAETVVIVQPKLFNTQNIKVYIPPGNLSATMKHAFLYWQNRTNFHFTFKFVEYKTNPDIKIIFVNKGMAEICERNDALACTKYRVLSNSSRTVNYISNVRIYVSKYDNTGKLMTNNQIYTIMLHEIGHSLGLGHSNERNSLMYKRTNSQIAEMQEIQYSDLKALFDIYGFKYSMENQ